MRHQDFRNSRQREFDADIDQPRPRAFGARPRFSQARSEIPSGPPVSGVIKWFSPEKGFGFIELSDGSGDAFLHGTVLAQNRFGIVQPGDILEVRVGPGHKGPHVTEVLSAGSSAAVTTPRRSRFQSATSAQASSDLAVEETGTVKWFNAERRATGSLLGIVATATSSVSSTGEKGQNRQGSARTRSTYY